MDGDSDGHGGSEPAFAGHEIRLGWRLTCLYSSAVLPIFRGATLEGARCLEDGRLTIFKRSGAYELAFALQHQASPLKQSTTR